LKDTICTDKYQENIFKVALPVSLEAFFQTSLGFVDQIIVGTLGATAVAAVGLCNSISFIVMLLYSAIGTGAGVHLIEPFSFLFQARLQTLHSGPAEILCENSCSRSLQAAKRLRDLVLSVLLELVRISGDRMVDDRRTIEGMARNRAGNTGKNL
jgi:hypothetical protein